MNIKRTIKKAFNISDRQAFSYHRYPLNFLRKKPSFFIIGTQKAGTSSVLSYLVQHPSVIPPIIKELHYFNMNYCRGAQYFHSLFRINVSARAITGEATPDYIDFPLTPLRLQRYSQDLKLIVVLRDPVQRAFSHFSFVQSYDKYESSISFEKGLLLENDRLRQAFSQLENDPAASARAISNYGYVYKGEYVTHIKKWLDYFDRSKILILCFSELKNNPQEIMRKVCIHLEIDESYIFNFSKTHNKTKYSREMQSVTKDRLIDHFSPYNAELFQLIGQEFEWQTR